MFKKISHLILFLACSQFWPKSLPIDDRLFWLHHHKIDPIKLHRSTITFIDVDFIVYLINSRMLQEHLKMREI